MCKPFNFYRDCFEVDLTPLQINLEWLGVTTMLTTHLVVGTVMNKRGRRYALVTKVVARLVNTQKLHWVLVVVFD